MLVASLLVALCVLPLSSPAAASPASAGPPLLCFPIEIGGRATLPSPEQALAPDDVVPATLALLGSSDAIVVHMETLRRAVLRLQGDERLGRLLAALDEAARGAACATSALAAAELSPDADLLAHAARARFDLAYARAAAAEAGLRGGGLERIADDLALARKALPRDGGLAFGCALVSFSVRRMDAAALHLQDAVVAARAGEPGLEANILSTFGIFFDRRDLDGVAAWAASTREQV